MEKAPIPESEEARMRMLRELGILDTPPEARFDAITKKATELLHVPISTVSIIDSDREWYKSCQGTTAREGDRSISFCGHAMLAEQMFIVEDTLKDPRFADNPMVIGAPHIRFYAGIALRERRTRLPIGVLCVKDTKPRLMNTQEIAILLDLAREAEGMLNEPKTPKDAKGSVTQSDPERPPLSMAFQWF